MQHRSRLREQTIHEDVGIQHRHPRLSRSSRMARTESSCRPSVFQIGIQLLFQTKRQFGVVPAMPLSVSLGIAFHGRTMQPGLRLEGIENPTADISEKKIGHTSIKYVVQTIYAQIKTCVNNCFWQTTPATHIALMLPVTA